MGRSDRSAGRERLRLERRDPAEIRKDLGAGIVGPITGTDWKVGVVVYERDGEEGVLERLGHVMAPFAKALALMGFARLFASGPMQNVAVLAEHEPVVAQPRMINAVAITDQRVGRAAQIGQAIPVGIVARERLPLQRMPGAQDRYLFGVVAVVGSVSTIRLTAWTTGYWGIFLTDGCAMACCGVPSVSG